MTMSQRRKGKDTARRTDRQTEGWGTGRANAVAYGHFRRKWRANWSIARRHNLHVITDISTMLLRAFPFRINVSGSQFTVSGNELEEKAGKFRTISCDREWKLNALHMRKIHTKKYSAFILCDVSHTSAFKIFIPLTCHVKNLYWSRFKPEMLKANTDLFCNEGPIPEPNFANIDVLMQTFTKFRVGYKTVQDVSQSFCTELPSIAVVLMVQQ